MNEQYLFGQRGGMNYFKGAYQQQGYGGLTKPKKYNPGTGSLQIGCGLQYKGLHGEGIGRFFSKFFLNTLPRWFNIIKPHVEAPLKELGKELLVSGVNKGVSGVKDLLEGQNFKDVIKNRGQSWLNDAKGSTINQVHKLIDKVSDSSLAGSGRKKRKHKKKNFILIKSKKSKTDIFGKK